MDFYGVCHRSSRRGASKIEGAYGMTGGTGKAARTAPAIDPKRAETLLAEMVAINSVNPSLVPGGAGEAEIARYVAGRLAAAGFEASVEGPAPDRPNAVGLLRGTGGGRSLMLVGHSDTVSSSGMDIPPFEPRLEGDRLYGLGACDMKSGLAAVLAAAEALARHGPRLRGDLIVAAVADEEYASIGVEDLVKRWRADGGVIAEPTGLNLIVAHKGFAWINVDVRGRAVHGSNFAEGVDAITKTAKVLEAYDRHDREILSAVRPELVSRPSVHASLISGGRELSTYPADCRVSFERRTVPGETREDIRREVAGLLDGIARNDPQFAAEADVFFFRDAYQVGREVPVVTCLAGAAEAATGRPAEYGSAAGWMDSAVMGAAGIPTVIFGPSGDGGHSPVEWASMASVVQVAEVFVRVAAAFCGRA
jgi:acetylornithine deacetylase